MTNEITSITHPDSPDFDLALSMVLSGYDAGDICEASGVSETTVRKMKRTIRGLAWKQFRSLSWDDLKALSKGTNSPEEVAIAFLALALNNALDVIRTADNAEVSDRLADMLTEAADLATEFDEVL